MFKTEIINRVPKRPVFQWIYFLTVTMLFGVFSVQAADGTGLTVDADKPVGKISPLVYGANYGPWALISMDNAPLAEQSGLTFYRFPAGAWGDQHNLYESDIDMFYGQTKGWNAQLSISVRLQGGTPEAAAKLVHYANIEKGYNIRYWSIGNEPNLYKNYSVDQLNKDWRPIAEAMRAVDPTIILMGPEVSQYPPTTDPKEYQAPLREWVRSFLKANGDLVDIVSIHRYPFPIKTNQSETAADLLANPPEWDTLIPDLRAVIKDATGRDLPVAVTEVNSNWDFGASITDTPEHAIWWADVLGRLIRQKVEVVNYWALSAQESSLGLLSRYNPRPAYYVYLLYKQFGTQLLTSDSTDKDVSVTAALKDDGSLTLMVINRATDAKTIPLALKAFTPSGAAAVWLLDRDHKAENTGTADLSSGTLSLPAESATLYIVSASK